MPKLIERPRLERPEIDNLSILEASERIIVYCLNAVDVNAGEKAVRSLGPGIIACVNVETSAGVEDPEEDWITSLKLTENNPFDGGVMEIRFPFGARADATPYDADPSFAFDHSVGVHIRYPFDGIGGTTNSSHAIPLYAPKYDLELNTVGDIDRYLAHHHNDDSRDEWVGFFLADAVEIVTPRS